MKAVILFSERWDEAYQESKDGFGNIGRGQGGMAWISVKHSQVKARGLVPGALYPPAKRLESTLNFYHDHHFCSSCCPSVPQFFMPVDEMKTSWDGLRSNFCLSSQSQPRSYVIVLPAQPVPRVQSVGRDGLTRS